MEKKKALELREEQHRKTQKKLQSESEQLKQDLSQFKRSLENLYMSTQSVIAEYPEIKSRFSRELSQVQQEGIEWERRQQKDIQEKYALEEQSFKKDKNKLEGE